MAALSFICVVCFLGGLAQANQAPKITVLALAHSSNGTVLIHENTPGVFMAFVRASDPDSGPEGEVECNIDNHIFELHYMPSHNEYSMAATASFDREVRDYFEVNLTCADSGTPSMSTYEIVSVKIEDLNDNAPEFEYVSYQVYVPENTDVGVVLCRLMAVDSDIGENGLVNYRSSCPWASIDGDSGDVRATVTFDYETSQKETCIFEAHDNGQPMLTSTAAVSVFIQDVDDNIPTFTRSIYTFMTSNGDETNEVGRVRAHDADSAPFNTFTYQLVAPGTDEAFSVDRDTGVITRNRLLDQDERYYYELVVLAVPNHSQNPEHVGEAVVKIYVMGSYTP